LMKSSWVLSHRSARQISKRLVKAKAPIKAASPFPYNVCCMADFCYTKCKQSASPTARDFDVTWMSSAMANLFHHDPTHCYGTGNSHCPAMAGDDPTGRGELPPPRDPQREWRRGGLTA